MPNWWNVPSLWIPDAFLLRQIHTGPRLVANMASATCTDGGGVLELEPREAELLFWPHDTVEVDPSRVDELSRCSAEAALDYVDKALALTGRLSKTDLLSLRGIWAKLSSRRAGRKSKPIQHGAATPYTSHDTPTQPARRSARFAKGNLAMALSDQ
jgi:hypothetical protein